jgi:hypothetical protein
MLPREEVKPEVVPPVVGTELRPGIRREGEPQDVLLSDGREQPVGGRVTERVEPEKPGEVSPAGKLSDQRTITLFCALLIAEAIRFGSGRMT